MKKEIWFFGFRFSLARYLVLCLLWTLFLCFIWPVIIGSYFFVSVAVCILCLIFAGIVNNKLLIALLVLFHINKKIIACYQNFMLVISALLGTWIFSLFVRMNTFIFLDHLFINTFSVFMYYKALVSIGNDDE